MDFIDKLSQELGKALVKKGMVAATAESCTGGGVATAITEISGSSGWFDRAFVTYSNDAKIEMLGVKPETLEAVGAVSESVVTEMAKGAIEHSKANISVAISGIAGPGGGTESKPVGTVCFAWACDNGWLKVETQRFSGDRAEVRKLAVARAIKEMTDYLQS